MCSQNLLFSYFRNLMAILTCYNKACSTKGKFEENENGEEACRYHPGAPVFHDALKVYFFCLFQNLFIRQEN